MSEYSNLFLISLTKVLISLYIQYLDIACISEKTLPVNSVSGVVVLRHFPPSVFSAVVLFLLFLCVCVSKQV